MKRKHLSAALAAMLAPVSLAVVLSGIAIDSRRVAVLERLPDAPVVVADDASADVAKSDERSARVAGKPAVGPKPAALPKPVAATPVELAPCCAALHAKSAAAEGDTRKGYQAAAQICDAASSDGDVRSALTKVRAAAPAAPLPAVCS